MLNNVAFEYAKINSTQLEPKSVETTNVVLDEINAEPKIADCGGTPVSERMEETDAYLCHVNYLLYGPHVRKNNQLVHSLAIDRDDLINLYNLGTGGVRLYFCSEPDSPHPYLSIIAVPYDHTGENVLVDHSGTSAIVNNLDPCPDKCPQNKCYHNSYSNTDLNWTDINLGGIVTRIWCKPNQKLPGTTQVWFDADGNPVI